MLLIGGEEQIGTWSDDAALRRGETEAEREIDFLTLYMRDKRAPKSRGVNPAKSTAGSQRSGRDNIYTFEIRSSSGTAKSRSCLLEDYTHLFNCQNAA